MEDNEQTERISGEREAERTDECWNGYRVRYDKAYLSSERMSDTGRLTIEKEQGYFIRIISGSMQGIPRNERTRVAVARFSE